MPEALPHSTPTAEPRRLNAERGLRWWAEGWALFMKSPGMWIVLGLILVLINLALEIIPILGALAGALIMPSFLASWMLAARKLDSGGGLKVADLFVAFQLKPRPMLILGALFVAATLLVLALTAAGSGIGVGVATTGSRGASSPFAALIGVGGLSVIVAIVLSFFIGTLLWFAPALVMFRDIDPVAALKASFAASLRNIVPFLLYGLIYVVAAFIASILFGLGWIVLIPLGLLTAYASYQDVFGT